MAKRSAASKARYDKARQDLNSDLEKYQKLVRDLRASDESKLAKTHKQKLPPDPYSEEGSHFRIVLLRNRVCHLARNPFVFREGSEPPCSLRLDPRDKDDNGSKKPAIEELTLFWKLVNDKCEEILSMD